MQIIDEIDIRFATYVPFEAPVVLIVKKIGPKLLLSICGFCWGATSLGMGKKQPEGSL